MCTHAHMATTAPMALEPSDTAWPVFARLVAVYLIRSANAAQLRRLLTWDSHIERDKPVDHGVDLLRHF